VTWQNWTSAGVLMDGGRAVQLGRPGSEIVCSRTGVRNMCSGATIVKIVGVSPRTLLET